jgi:hypothetical protein
VPAALKRFKRECPRKLQHQPHPHALPCYGERKQYATLDDTSPVLGKDVVLFVQPVCGTFLYYARAIDCTMLVALSAIATEQQAPTQKTLDKVNQFLDYAASQDTAIVTYAPIDMVLAIHSDASYLSVNKARSRVGGHFFMASDIEHPPNNGAVHTIAKIIKAVMSSAAEAEVGALYISTRAKRCPCELRSKKWGTPNLAHQCKRITPMPWALLL